MARRQTTMWTALPHGIRTDRDGSKWLLLSAIMSPRLDWDTAETTLGAYPDFTNPSALAGSPRNWAETVAATSFGVELTTETVGATPVALPARSVRKRAGYAPESGLWDSFFYTQTLVKSYTQPNLSQVDVKSFSMKNASKNLQTHFAALVAKPQVLYKIPEPTTLLAPSGLVISPLTAHLSREVRAAVLGQTRQTAAVTAAEADAAEFEAFHRPFITATGAKFLTREARLALEAKQRRVDFHKMIAGLGQFPALLPRLGIVVELEVAWDQAIAAAMKGKTRIRVSVVMPDPSPGGPVGAGPPERRIPCPWTALDLKTKTVNLQAVPTWFGAKSQSGELANGYMVVRDSTTTGYNDPVQIANVDVDLATARAYTAIEEIARSLQPVAAGSQAAATVSKTMLAAGMPTLGQPVLAFSVASAGAKLQTKLGKVAAKNLALANNPTGADVVNHAEDLVRGYRVDVWDNKTKLWHRLCQRTGVYAIGDSPITWNGANETLTDEGWVQLATTAPADADPNAPGEIRLHEQLFSWGGWSLVVKRPGAALAEDGSGVNTMTRTYVGPDGETYDLGEFNNPGLPLHVGFRVPAGTLPRLRFGTAYRFRARAVDLAGNSVAFSSGSTTTPPAGASDSYVTVTREVTHKRYEPVKPPTVVITSELTRIGETPTCLVVRSDYGVKPAEATSRHICPPRSSFTMSEAHGGFELTTEGRPLNGSETMWKVIADKDNWDFPKDANNKQLPLASIPTRLPYLPDYPSRGAAFAGLPGQSTTKSSSIAFVSSSPLQRATSVRLSSSKTVSVGSLRIPFTGSPWYNRSAFKLLVKGIEGTDARLSARDNPAAPAWDSTRRVLTVELPKAEQVSVKLSSYVSEGDLKNLGMYQWGVVQSMRTLNKTISGTPRMLTSVMTPSFATIPTTALSTLAEETRHLINVTTLGRNWSVTPAETITLIHPVKRPLIGPNFTRHLTAVRSAGQTTAVLKDWVQIHGKSTGRLAMNAKWKENVDDPAHGLPKWGATAVQRSGQAFDIGLKRTDTVALSLGSKAPSGLSMPVTPSNSITDGKLQRHSFGDTKHRKVTYQLVATSRFADFFDEGTVVTRTGNTRTIHVKSTARPEPPQVDLVIPAFKWTSSGGGTSSTRSGGRIRIYLKRPWFGSGDNEQLGIVIWAPRTDMVGFDKLQQYVTEWGEDPLFTTRGHLPQFHPTGSQFLGYTSKKTTLKIPEYTGHKVTVIGYSPQFDAETNRWFVDVAVNQGKAYFPFIKLGLVRYQPYSLSGLELSRVTVVDAVQLAPDRSASVSWNGNTFTIYVNGRSFIKSRTEIGPRMTVTVERREGPDYAWVPVTLYQQKTAEVLLSTYTPAMTAYGDVRTFWKKALSFYGQTVTRTSEFRAVIREYETHWTGGPDSQKGTRPTYIDIINIKKPT